MGSKGFIWQMRCAYESSNDSAAPDGPWLPFTTVGIPSEARSEKRGAVIDAGHPDFTGATRISCLQYLIGKM